MTSAEVGKLEPGSSTLVEVRALRDAASRERAADLAIQGLPIGLYNVAVCAILGDGSNSEFVNAVPVIKGENRGQRPLGACLPTSEFVQLLDSTKIPSVLHDTFMNADELLNRTGSLCFIRGPITEKAAAMLPASMVSRIDGTPVIQNWDAVGHQPTNLLLAQMRKAGIRYPAITSMNISGAPEIIDQVEAINFSGEHGIPLFLTDDETNRAVQGSYTILGITDTGVKLIREGNLPGHMFNILLGTDIDTSDFTTAKSVQPLSLPSSSFEGLDPRMVRMVILSSLKELPFPKIQKITAKQRKTG